MTDQKPRYDQALDYGGEQARYSEYHQGETTNFEDGTGQLVAGEVLHVTTGPDGHGQLYIVENPEAGFPDVLLASELLQPIEPTEPTNEKPR